MPNLSAIFLSHFLNCVSEISSSARNFLKTETATIYADISWIALLFIIRPPTVTKRRTILSVLALIGVKFLSATCTDYWNHSICFSITISPIRHTTFIRAEFFLFLMRLMNKNHSANRTVTSRDISVMFFPMFLSWYILCFCSFVIYCTLPYSTEENNSSLYIGQKNAI